MDNKRIWAVRAGRDNQADHLFLNRGQIAIGLGSPREDASALAPTRAAFKAAFGRDDAAPGSIPIQAGQLFRFVHEMRVGDRVIYPRKIDRTLRWGEVASAYLHDATDGPEFPHRRAVRWLDSKSRDVFSQGALYELGSVLTLFEVKTFADEFRRKFGLDDDAVEDVVAEDDIGAMARDIAETTRDFIAKSLKARFKGLDMEHLVAELFRAMGCKAQSTRPSKDDGVDVIAHRDPLGVEPPLLKIQVKTHDNNISADAVKAFYASIHERDVGVFVTSGGFTSAALSFARHRGNLRTIDGVELVDLIQTHYEAFDLKYRQKIPLRRVLAPDVAAEE